MTEPSSDTIARALEADAAWAAQEESARMARMWKNEAASYRRLHFRAQPVTLAFDKISLAITQLHAGASPDAILRDIERHIIEARQKVENIKRSQDEQVKREKESGQR